jgi:hypothetical protein
MDWTSGADLWGDSMDTSYFSNYTPEYDAWVQPGFTEPDYTQYMSPQDYSFDIAPQPQGVPAWMSRPSVAPQQAPGAPGAAAPASMLDKLLMGGLGAAPGLMGALGQLIGGGKSGTSPNMSPNQKALSAQTGQALGAMQPGAQNLWNAGSGLMGQLAGQTSPMQQQQQSILAALAPQAANMASGNMQIPPALQALVKQAYDPYIGDIAEQAINSARNRGFSGGADLLQQGPAGAIAGPALARAAGMQAQSLLDAMLKFPQASANIAGAYNQPINQATGIAQGAMAPQLSQVTGLQNMFNSYPMGQTTQNNIWPQVAQSLGQGMAGAAQGYAKPDQQAQQQQQFNTLLNVLMGNKQSAGGMSGIYS